VDEVFEFIVGHGEGSAVIQSIANGWVRHWVWSYEGKRRAQLITGALSLSHPVIPELVGLPRNFDTLVEEAMKRRCPNTGKELGDPSVCLFCGDIFCSQALCCSRNELGGCNQHLEKYVLSL
jgi:E3 ubiquitin-protein ligase UBR1